MSETPRRQLLLVEDDADIAAVATMALESLGDFEVIICSCGLEAIATASDRRPDVVLLDVMMPGMDGPTTLAELRQVAGLESTPVIFMTARAQQDEVERYRKLGAIGVIPKPFDPMTLAADVSRLLAGAERSG